MRTDRQDAFGEAIDQVRNSSIPQTGHGSRSYLKVLGCHFVQNSAISNNGNNPEPQKSASTRAREPSTVEFRQASKANDQQAEDDHLTC